MDDAEDDGWAFEIKGAEFLVDLRSGNVWRDGELINCAGLTRNRHFKVLRRLLKDSPATVPLEDLLDGIGRDSNQAVYDTVNALRRRLGPGVIRNDQRRGYALQVKAKPVPLPYPGKSSTPREQPADVAVPQTAAIADLEGPQASLPLGLGPSAEPYPSVPDVAGLDLPGHFSLLLAVSGVFGTMVALALLVEVAYQWPNYSTWALPTATGLGVSTAVVAFLVFARMRRQARVGTPLSLGVAVAVLFGWSAVLSFVVAPSLPDEPLVPATVQTMSAKVGWVKSVGEALFLPMLALVPLQTIFVLATEARMGRATQVQNLLYHRKRAIPPAGAHYIPPLVASAIFLLVASSWIFANGILFTSLKNGEHYGLFVALNFARVASGLLTLLWVLVWYLSSLSHLKRAAASSQNHSPARTSHV